MLGMLVAFSVLLAGPEMGEGPDGLRVRPGYRVTPAVRELEGARFLEFDARGTLYVSRPGTGDIVTFRDEDGDGVYQRLGTFVEGRESVHGMCFADGWLWFTQTGSVSRGRDTDGDGDADEVEEIIGSSKLPGGGGHWWRSILVGPDYLLTSIGDSGNIQDETATDRQKIFRFSLDGSRRELFASGIRNTEKLRFRPGTDEVWGVDHGSDWFGRTLGERTGNQPVTDNHPPDEFNRYVPGGFYGHPFVTGNRLPRYEFRERADILELAARTTPPEWAFGAHWAANAFTFLDPAVTPKCFPADHSGDAFVACRGSWNRSQPAGYKVVRVLFDHGTPYGQLTIVDALGTNGRAVLRPVDCAQAPDGSVLFSSDSPGRIYRITSAGTQR